MLELQLSWSSISAVARICQVLYHGDTRFYYEFPDPSEIPQLVDDIYICGQLPNKKLKQFIQFYAAHTVTTTISVISLIITQALSSSGSTIGDFDSRTTSYPRSTWYSVRQIVFEKYSGGPRLKYYFNRRFSQLFEYYSRILFEISRAVAFYIYKPTYKCFNQCNAISYPLLYYPIYFHYHSHQNK